MKKLRKEELETIVGGTTFTASMLNAITSAFRVLLDGGRGLGSAFRRFGEGKVCPLE